MNLKRVASLVSAASAGSALTSLHNLGYSQRVLEKIGQFAPESYANCMYAFNVTPDYNPEILLGTLVAGAVTGLWAAKRSKSPAEL